MSNVFEVCKRVATEGTVLLKNENNLLPLCKGTRLAVFGRMQTSYYRSGTGSGGNVNAKEIPCFLNSLKANSDLVLDEELINIYTEWEKENPFDDGGGIWAREPWFQKEMPISEEFAKKFSAKNDAALIIIGRTAGEDHDNEDVEGSYKLTADEQELISHVCRYFKKVIVALNVGNIIDLSFMDEYAVQSVMYIWQGGMAGADAFADVLSGRRYPSGKLSDTQLYGLSSHPTTASFGKVDKITYDDDIYVGYRYFETFARNEVRYPFGYGLGYTEFECSYEAFVDNDFINVNATVKNIGKNKGKEVIQVYYQSPCGGLGNPSRQLAEFVKTKELEPSESQTLTVKFPIEQMASFDDEGVTGNKSCFVLLQGDYNIYAGTDVRSAECVLTFNMKSTCITQRLSSVMTPYENFKVMKAENIDGEYKLSNRDINGKPSAFSREENNVEEIEVTGDRNFKLLDVANGKCSLDDFVAQLTDAQLATLVCGEGMNSPKATSNSTGALGGQTEDLAYYGIPVCCVADGPCGIKLGKAVQTIQTPNGTMIACTWNEEIAQELFSCIGAELKELEVDSLLGPGINIHRSPLCGRNFEYLSEDPYLTGKIGAYITRGIAEHGSYSTIKHFCCNNQEKSRSDYDVVVSERALREIYLKPFEITVKKGDNVLIMTALNMVNGFKSASNYDLTCKILRDEWNFQNIVMTDWWTKCNLSQCEKGNKSRLDAMVRSQNDVYMVCADALVQSNNILEGIKNGTVLRAELQICCKHILEWIMKTNTFKEFVKRGCVPKYPVIVNTDNMTTVDEISNIQTDKEYIIKTKAGRNTAFIFTVSSELDSLAQLPVTVKVDSTEFLVTINGTNGSEEKVTRFVKMDWTNEHKIKASFSDAVSVKSILVKQNI